MRNQGNGQPSSNGGGSEAPVPASARIAHLARYGAQFGTVTGPVTVDMATVLRRKREMVERQTAKHLQIYKTSGAELIMGNGHFVAPKTVEV